MHNHKKIIHNKKLKQMKKVYSHNYRVSLQDCVSLGNNEFSNKSLYVIIDSKRNGGNRAASFNIAYEGGFLEHMGDTFYMCKRIVADNLGLIIMSDYPAIM